MDQFLHILFSNFGGKGIFEHVAHLIFSIKKFYLFKCQLFSLWKLLRIFPLLLILFVLDLIGYSLCQRFFSKNIGNYLIGWSRIFEHDLNFVWEAHFFVYFYSFFIRILRFWCFFGFFSPYLDFFFSLSDDIHIFIVKFERNFMIIQLIF